MVLNLRNDTRFLVIPLGGSRRRDPGAHGVNDHREMKNRAIVIAVTVAVSATVAERA